MRVKPSDLKQFVAGFLPAQIDEMAFPSYTHWNPAARWLMWKRLWIVQDLCRGLQVKRALDYGTGTGIMLPFLSELAPEVIGVDIHIEPAVRLSQKYGLKNVKLHQVDTMPLPLEDNSVDLVICLDVLEHIQELDALVQEIRRVMTPKGILIISGPSENVIYKLGRFVAGFSKRATYHRWNVDDVNEVAGRHLTLKKRQRLFPFLRFFEFTIFEK